MMGSQNTDCSVKMCVGVSSSQAGFVLSLFSQSASDISQDPHLPEPSSNSQNCLLPASNTSRKSQDPHSPPRSTQHRSQSPEFWSRVWLQPGASRLMPSVSCHPTSSLGNLNTQNADNMVTSTEFQMALLISVLQFTGVSGGYLNVFYSERDDVSLPCANVVHPDCSSTVWLYSGAASQAPVEKVVMGQIKKEGKNPERLTLGPYCSLDICNITHEDTGVYVCQQYIAMGRKNVEKDSVIQLSVLSISVSTPEETFNNSITVTLTCSLHTYGGPDTCGYFLQEGISLSWVNETGGDLEEDSSYEVIQESGCNVSLVVPLLTMENNRKWLCQLTETTRKSFVYLISVLSGNTVDSFETNFIAPERQNKCQRPIEPKVSELPVSRIVLCVALPLMVIIVAVFMTRRIRQQEATYSGIEL